MMFVDAGQHPIEEFMARDGRVASWLFLIGWWVV
jgi:hypothetical protein